MSNIERTKRAVLFTTVGLLALSGCKKDEATPNTAQAKAAVTAAPAGPTDIVYAASTELRVVDFARGEVVASVPLKRAVSQIRFLGGKTAYVAASGGLYAVDAQRHELVGQLTKSPARAIDLADDGASIRVLAHDVIVHEDTSREVLPFRLTTLSIPEHAKVAETTIGQRIFFAAARPDDSGHDLVVGEDGRIRLFSGSEILSGEGIAVDPHAGVSAKDSAIRVRHEAVRHEGHAYLPVEGYPSRILDIDLKSGATTAIPLDRGYPLRGVGVSPDGATLVVNVGIGLVVVDLATREITDRIETPDPTTGVSFSSDGRFVYTAQVVDGTGGAVHALSLDPPAHVKKIHLDDISPWALAVRPR